MPKHMITSQQIRVLELIHHYPNHTQTEHSLKLGQTRAAISYHYKNLKAKGLLIKKGNDFLLTEEAIKILTNIA